MLFLYSHVTDRESMKLRATIMKDQFMLAIVKYIFHRIVCYTKKQKQNMSSFIIRNYLLLNGIKISTFNDTFKIFTFHILNYISKISTFLM